MLSIGRGEDWERKRFPLGVSRGVFGAAQKLIFAENWCQELFC